MLRRDLLKNCFGFILPLGLFKNKAEASDINIATHLHLYKDKLYENLDKEFTSYNNRKWKIFIQDNKIFLQYIYPNNLCKQFEVFLTPYVDIEKLDNDISIFKNKNYDIIVIHLHETDDNITKMVGIVGVDINDS